MEKIADGSLRIRLRKVGKDPEEFDFVIGDDFFETMPGEVKSGSVRVKIGVRSIGGGRYGLRAYLKGKIVVECSRCLGDLGISLDESAETIAVEAEVKGDDPDEDVIVADKESGEADLSWFIYETIILSLPIQRVHKEGECDDDMIALLGRLSHEGEKADEATDPRWKDLKGLR